MITGFWAGFITTLICFVGAVAIVVCNKWIKKVTNCYFFWLGLSIAILTYFIVCRFSGSWIKFADAANSGNIIVNGIRYEFSGSTYEGAQIISRAFLFDFCPFFGFLTPVLLIVDPSRKAARSVSPILLLGSLFTCTFGFLTNSQMSLDPQFFFIGPPGWELYVMLHIIGMWLSVGVLCNTPKFEFEGYLIFLGCLILYISYILIAKTVLGCELATSGLSYRDWIINIGLDGKEHKATYYPITQLMGNNPYLAMGFTWPLEVLILSGIIALWDKGFKHFKWHQYGNKKGQKWYFWYNFNSFVEPYRIPWKPLKTVSLFWSGKLKKTKKNNFK